MAEMSALEEIEKTARQNVHLWVEALELTNYRNYTRLSLRADRRPVVLLGPNGAGKTNLMEAVSLLAPGQGLRRVAYSEIAKSGGSGDWAVAANLHANGQPVQIGTGLQPVAATNARSGRIVRINGETQSGSGALADYVEMVWLTPASDGLFTGPASERRRFLDRLILCFDPGYRTRAGHFDRAMRQRNRLLDDGGRSPLLDGLETIMAETGVAIAAARVEAVTALRTEMQTRRGRSGAVFPWADLQLEGDLETALEQRPAIDIEDWYCSELARGRERDRAAGRALMGPHRSDLSVGNGPKGIPAKISSTGEQKALLISLILAHAELSTMRRNGIAPILLLDEIAAHLDDTRRSALFNDLLRIGSQAWMSGTDHIAFAALSGQAQFFCVEDGDVKAI